MTSAGLVEAVRSALAERDALEAERLNLLSRETTCKERNKLVDAREKGLAQREAACNTLREQLSQARASAKGLEEEATGLQNLLTGERKKVEELAERVRILSEKLKEKK